MNKANEQPTVAPGQPRAREVVYVAPPAEIVDEYARAVCTKLAERHGGQQANTETVRGFSAFIRAVVQTQVNYLNRRGNHVTQEI